MTNDSLDGTLKDLPVASVKATDQNEVGLPLENVFSPYSFRWAIYDRPSRTIFFGGPDVKTHMSVAEKSRLLSNLPSYYRPGPDAKMFGGFVCRSSDGSFYYDPFSGTFPGWAEHICEAENALRDYCATHDLSWKLYDPDALEFQRD